MEEEPAAVVQSASEAGVGRVICVGIDVESSKRSVELAHELPEVLATAGVHPHTASEFGAEARSAVEGLLADSRVVGVGETGLDYYRKLSPVDDQRRAFRTHIAMARSAGKALVVHVREAWKDALDILEAEHAERVVLHCFSGDEPEVREAAQRGYFISFAGNVTYSNAAGLRQAAAMVPDESILSETDSPFLTPQPFRGKPNTPANIMATLDVLAAERGVARDDIVATTKRNAGMAFPQLG
jgi:TatD DNase family protein